MVLKGYVPNSGLIIGISLAAGITVGITWLFTHHIPRCQRNKVGIAIAITADDDNEIRQIQADFVRELKNRLLSDPEAANFQTIVLPKFASDQVVLEQKVHEYLAKTRTHLMLYGYSRRRIVNGKEAHILQFEGAVRHAPQPKEICDKFAQEFGSALPRRLVLPRDGDVFAFELNSAWVDLCVRYVIGIAANLSGDFRYAERLYLSAEERIRKEQSPPAFVQPIARNLPMHLLDLYGAWRGFAAQEYYFRRSTSALQRLDEVSTKVLHRDPDNYGALLSKAICYFRLHHDFDKAKACIKQCEREKDVTWRYSLAFLLAYEGDLKAAHEEYRRAFRGPTSDVTLPLQCEEFIYSVLAEEPEKQELHFCTALINYNVKGDFVAAANDFRTFLGSPNSSRHPDAIAIAKLLLDKCDPGGRNGVTS